MLAAGLLRAYNAPRRSMLLLLPARRKTMALPVTKVSKRIVSRAKKIREDLHRHPELSFEEVRTTRLIAERLRKIGVDDVKEGVVGTGVLGLLRGARPGATVALRADIDALPIQEETGLPYASVHEGVMHACGHDGHTAILLAVAELLAGMRKKLAGKVKFIFQPAEEGFAGGRAMVQAGCLKRPKVDAIFALHGSSRTRSGRVEVSRTQYAGMNGFRVEITGKGGHGSAPHTFVDPIAIGAQIVTAAQTIVSRESRPDEPTVLSFCSFQAGTKDNIIPDTALLLGTIRGLDVKVVGGVRKSLARVARNVAAAMRGKAIVEDLEFYPPTRNDPDLVEFVQEVGRELLGSRNVGAPKYQTMGAEDFSYYLADQGGVPGAMFSIGIESDENHHTSRFDFGSAAIEPGILMLANLAVLFLARGTKRK
jgi:amidohydrolase